MIPIPNDMRQAVINLSPLLLSGIFIVPATPVHGARQPEMGVLETGIGAKSIQPLRDCISGRTVYRAVRHLSTGWLAWSQGGTSDTTKVCDAYSSEAP